LYMLCYGIGLFIFMMIDIELFANGTAYLSSIYLVVLMIPTLATTVRRLHDIDKSGWWYFFMLISLLGPIMFLIWMCTGSKSDENKFGRNPLLADESTPI